MKIELQIAHDLNRIISIIMVKYNSPSKSTAVKKYSPLSGGQLVLAYIIITVCFGLAMTVLCGELFVERAYRKE